MLGQSLQAVAVGIAVERCRDVDVGDLAGAGEADVGAFAGRVLVDDEMDGVGGLTLGWNGCWT